jgi:hypothetical protein
MISAIQKRNSKRIGLYEDNAKDAEDSLRKDEAISLGDVDRLPETE